MKKILTKIYTENERYWQIFFYIGFLWGFITSVIYQLQNVTTSGSILTGIFYFTFWSILATLSGIVSGLLTAFIWGTILFIPFKGIQSIYKTVKN